MKEQMITWKTSIVMLLSGVAEVLGSKGVLMLMWVCSMALDYASGTMAAKKCGKWKSKKAREGLMHKGGMILVVLVALMFDLTAWTVSCTIDFGIIWPCVVFPLCCTWYFFTECGSILENCQKMGITVPGWMIAIMKAGLSDIVKAIMRAMGKAVSEDDETDDI